MVIFCNGSFKSGSTWIFNLLKEIRPCDEIPQEFLNRNWVNDSLLKDKIGEFCEYYPKNVGDYVFKTHFRKKFLLNHFLENEFIFIVHSTRDYRDVIVSAYFHYLNRGVIDCGFEEFYWRKGRYILYVWSRYDLEWEGIAGHERFKSISFESLKDDFSTVVRDLAGFVGVEESECDISSLVDRTSLGSLRDAYKGKGGGGQSHFRKGKVGDWKNFLTEKIENDLTQIVGNNLSLSDRMLFAIRDQFSNLKNKISKL